MFCCKVMVVCTTGSNHCAAETARNNVLTHPAAAGESDWVAAMSTVVCELHVHFDYFHWTGFYRAGPDDSSMLVVGPYQGALACQRIPFRSV